ncbi:nuclear transport factor 2 family protein [Streptomyces sp. NBC_01450]|uniref:nuclear transport factor 2 family protein n=1 Tax=Streptomyces sp. NBC_01450 TaxID=2903871 RepID=UPI002E32BE5C|nr:nuclear transport factor 2 family protein [Streptomyces sp. NBC_01450]
MTISAEATLAGVQTAIATYAHAIDAGRTEAIPDLFTEDGVAEITGQGTFEGREAIGKAYAAFTPQAPQLHLVGNTLLTSPPGDVVTASSNLVFFVRGEEGWAVQLVGTYEDTLVRVGDVWKFRRRVTTFN